MVIKIDVIAQGDWDKERQIKTIEVDIDPNRVCIMAEVLGNATAQLILDAVYAYTENQKKLEAEELVKESANA